MDIEHNAVSFPHTETELNLYGPGIVGRLHQILEPIFGNASFQIITDGTIWNIVSARFSAFLAARPETRIHVLPAFPPPYASDLLVAEVACVLAGNGAVPVAVGAGTINDIVKRAAFEKGRRYVCVPTAPSVDGFTSFGAALTVAGFKRTLGCPPPRCVVADEDIIVGAPPEMIASGYGDIIAKLTGGADWIVADAMDIEAIDPVAWELAQKAAVALLPRAKEIRSGARDAIGILYKGLVSTGLAMQRYRDSRPASGSEHLMSHSWEMMRLGRESPDASHGFKVAIGTLISAALMHELFAEDGALGRSIRDGGFAPRSDLLAYRLRLAKLVPEGSPARAAVMGSIRTKTPSPEEQAKRVRTAERRWSELGERVARQVPPFAELKRALRAAGCPVEPAQIGLSREACADGLRIASLIRGRYTVLDLASELGILDAAADAVFTSKYFREYVSA